MFSRHYFTDTPAESITPVLALYEDGRLVGLEMQTVSEFSSGTSEIELSAESDDAVSDISVFLLEGTGDMVPLTASLEIPAADIA